MVIDLALRIDRVLLTEHKDFGQFVYAAGKTTDGVILLRLAANAWPRIGKIAKGLVERRETD